MTQRNQESGVCPTCGVLFSTDIVKENGLVATGGDWYHISKGKGGFLISAVTVEIKVSHNWNSTYIEILMSR